MSRTGKIVRWLARILGTAVFLFWGSFLLADLFGVEARSTRPLDMGDVLRLAAIIVSLIGLMVAWKWEIPGAILTLAGWLFLVVLNWKILVSAFLLMPIVGLLFILSAWLNTPTHRGSNPRPSAEI